MNAGETVAIELPRQIHRIAKIGKTETSRLNAVLVDTYEKALEVTNGFAVFRLPLLDTDGLDEIPPFLLSFEDIHTFLGKIALRAADKVMVIATVGLDIPVYRLVVIHNGYERNAMEFEAKPYGEEHGFYPFNVKRLIPDHDEAKASMTLGLETLEPLVALLKATGSHTVRFEVSDRWSVPMRTEIGDGRTVKTEHRSVLGAVMQMWTEGN